MHCDQTKSGLCLFFTERTGFSDWEELGMLDRELALYRELAKKISSVCFVTYGNMDRERAMAEKLDVSALPIPWHGNYFFSTLGLLLKYRKILKGVAVFKSNQFPGAEIPYTLKKCLGGKFVLRAGFIPSFFFAKAGAVESLVAAKKKLEQKLMAGADLVMISTQWQKEYLIEELRADQDKIHVVPNFVSTELFCPRPNMPKKTDLCFIGRDDAQKNLTSLLQALVILKGRGIDLSLRLIGSCIQSKFTQQFIAEHNLSVQMNLVIPHGQLPTIFNESKIFILPSFYEGHPKALLEAMSSGLACIGTDVPGIREEIEDGVDGLLCDTNAESIGEHITQLLENNSLAMELGHAARKKIVSRYRIELVADLEWQILADLLKQPA